MAFRPTLLARVLRSSTLFLGWPDEGVNSLFFHARAGRRNVVATPHGGSIGLRDCLVHPVAEDPELIVEVMIDADDLFAHVGRRIVAAGKRGAAGGSRENAGLQQELGVRIQQRSGNLVAGERPKDGWGAALRVYSAVSRCCIRRAEALTGCRELSSNLRGDLVD